MRDLVFVKFNSKLRNKREIKERDPLEKEVDDVLGDEENEFITGIVPSPDVVDVQEPSQNVVPVQAQDGAPTSQAKRKRHVPVHPKKKKQKIRSLQSLLRDVAVQQSESSSDSENGDADVAMRSSDSDYESPY